ncbi:unnamed protein product [Lactuca saligna]|uniref:Uncharacterized protein n=1 Tax=Lactuca saligna TaxID=75948 RepID=A0AA35YPN1_LACSI|nr:unnamed protein product [Lactuca saligna]
MNCNNTVPRHSDGCVVNYEFVWDFNNGKRLAVFMLGINPKLFTRLNGICSTPSIHNVILNSSKIPLSEP